MTSFKDTVKNAKVAADKVLAEKAITIRHALFSDIENESAYTYSVSAEEYEFSCHYLGDRIEYTLWVWRERDTRKVIIMSGKCSIHEIGWLKDKVQERITEFLVGGYHVL